MTNDELTALAIEICNGDEDKTELLWLQLRRYIAKSAIRWNRAFQGKNGATVDDLIQSSYFALLTALRQFNPEKGSFINYFTYSMKHEFAKTLGILSQQDKNAPLDNAMSLDAPMESQKVSDASAVDEFVEDEQATQAFQEIEDRLVHDHLCVILSSMLKQLHPREQKILHDHYWNGVSFAEIARQDGVCKQCIDQIKSRAFAKIKSMPEAAQLRQFF